MKQKNKSSLSRAEKHFVKALLSIMKEKPYQEITVLELAEAADYDRRTYYRYFTSKEEILKLYCSHILSEMVDMLKEKGHLTFQTGFISYFEFWEKHIDFLCLLESNELLHYLANQQDDLLYHYVGKSIQPEIPNNLEKVSEFSKVSFYFTSGGLWNILVRWIKEESRKTPQELTKYILTYFKEVNNYIN